MTAGFLARGMLVVVACGVAALACAPSPRDEPPRSARAPRAGPVALHGRGCPTTDAETMELMRRYDGTAPAARAPELALLPYRHTTGLAERRRVVVRDSAAWAALWPRLVGTYRPAAPLPAVDFAREMLVVASMGTRPTGGHTVTIDGALARNDTLHVTVTERSPGGRCGTTAALTAPAAIARLARRDGAVRFADSATTTECP